MTNSPLSGVEVAGVAPLHGIGVGRQDLGPIGTIQGQPGRMGLVRDRSAG